VQGVIKAYDPDSGEGIVVRDLDRSEHLLAADALVGSVFRTLRQGQRIVYDLDGDGHATHVRTGAEVDMGLPTDPNAR
jgi:CspA family cold shock protein